jgi:hypothetical protein
MLGSIPRSSTNLDRSTSGEVTRFSISSDGIDTHTVCQFDEGVAGRTPRLSSVGTAGSSPVLISNLCPRSPTAEASALGADQ